MLEFQHGIDTKDLAKNASLFKNTVQQIDKGILLGAPLPNMPRLLPTIASKLNNDCAGKHCIFITIILCFYVTLVLLFFSGNAGFE